jgi:plasmid maintenance system antidote protein VapI
MLCIMGRREPPATITDVIRAAIVDSGVGDKSLSREAGVARASIQRFVDGRQSLRLDMADRLAAHYGLSLVQQG